MDNYQLSNLMRRSPCSDCFLGVFARDTLPDLQDVSYPIALIVNSDKISEPGTHWLAIHAKSADQVVFFDSFGKPPLFYGIEIDMYLNKYFNGQYRENRIQVQAMSSDMCGLFCVFFLYNMCAGLTLPEIMRKFEYPKHLKSNDALLIKFSKTVFSSPVHQCTDRVDGAKRQTCLPMYKIIRNQ